MLTILSATPACREVIVNGFQWGGNLTEWLTERSQLFDEQRCVSAPGICDKSSRQTPMSVLLTMTGSSHSGSPAYTNCCKPPPARSGKVPSPRRAPFARVVWKTISTLSIVGRGQTPPMVFGNQRRWTSSPSKSTLTMRLMTSRGRFGARYIMIA